MEGAAIPPIETVKPVISTEKRQYEAKADYMKEGMPAKGKGRHVA